MLAHQIGLWDAIAEARRLGSLDSSIRSHVGNDLQRLAASLPQLRAMAYNGAKIGRKLLGDVPHPQLQDLPSSSPAYTLAYADKLAAWSVLRPYAERLS